MNHNNTVKRKIRFEIREVKLYLSQACDLHMRDIDIIIRVLENHIKRKNLLNLSRFRVSEHVDTKMNSLTIPESHIEQIERGISHFVNERVHEVIGRDLEYAKAVVALAQTN